MIIIIILLELNYEGATTDPRVTSKWYYILLPKNNETKIYKSLVSTLQAYKLSYDNVQNSDLCLN